MEFLNKVVLITGAAGAIGKETAVQFAKEGAKLALVDLELDALEKVAEELNMKEEDFILLTADVTIEEQVQQYVQKTKELFGRIDVFFNNAGVEGKAALTKDYPTDALNHIIDVNIKGLFWGLKYVLQVMEEQKSGSIINTSSIAGQKGLPKTSVYNASKFAVIGFTKTAAVESGASGIRVNAICPALVNSRMMRSLEQGMAPDNPEAAKALLTTKVPLGRYSEVEEVAQGVLFLASEKASFITGIALGVDGGINC